MTVKTIIISNDPNFVSFSDWLNAKLAAAQASGNMQEVQKINDALLAKENANKGLDTVTTSVQVDKQGDVTTETTTAVNESVAVPEFDYYWNQWMTEFNVTISIETI